MLQRHVEKDPLDMIQCRVGADVHATGGETARLLVGSKSAHRAAIDIARKLVEQQDQRQSAPRTIRPGIEFALCGAIHHRRKMQLDLFVPQSEQLLRLATGEPETHAIIETFRGQRARTEPEVQHLMSIVHGVELSRRLPNASGGGVGVDVPLIGVLR